MDKRKLSALILIFCIIIGSEIFFGDKFYSKDLPSYAFILQAGFSKRFSIFTIILHLFFIFPFLYVRYLIRDKSVPVVNTLLPENFPPKIMAIFPHPDDEVTVAGQIFHETANKNAEITIVILTAGEGGTTSSDFAKEHLAEIRKKEARASAKLFGASHVQGSFPDGKLGEVEPSLLKSYIYEQIKKYKPTIILTFDDKIGYYGHQDHIVLAKLIRAVVTKNKDAPDFSVQSLYMVTMPPKVISTARKFSKKLRNAYPIANSVTLPQPTHAIIIKDYGKKIKEIARAHSSQKAVMNLMLPGYLFLPTKLYFRLFDRVYFYLVDTD